MLMASVDSLKKELALAKSSGVAFMTAGDRAALEKSKVTDGASFDIIEGLKPFFTGELKSLKGSMGYAVELLEEPKLNSVDLPKMKDAVLGLSVGVPKSFGILNSLVESKDEASTEGLESVSGTLEKFGFGASAPGFDVPGSLQSMQKSWSSDVRDSTPPSVPVKPHVGDCNYKLVQGQSNHSDCTRASVTKEALGKLGAGGN